MAEARACGELDADGHYIRFEGVFPGRGTAFVNTTRVYGRDGTSAWDLTQASIEARRQMDQLLRFLIVRVPGCERASRIDASTVIGVRETRRIRGQHLLTEEDILAGLSYDDTILKVWRHCRASTLVRAPRPCRGRPRAEVGSGSEASATGCGARARSLKLAAWPSGSRRSTVLSSARGHD